MIPCCIIHLFVSYTKGCMMQFGAAYCPMARAASAWGDIWCNFELGCSSGLWAASENLIVSSELSPKLQHVSTGGRFVMQFGEANYFLTRTASEIYPMSSQLFYWHWYKAEWHLVYATLCSSPEESWEARNSLSRDVVSNILPLLLNELSTLKDFLCLLSEYIKHESLFCPFVCACVCIWSQ